MRIKMEAKMNKNIMYQLAPYFKLGIQNDELFLGFGSIQKKIKDKKMQKTCIEVAYKWQNPQSVNEVLKELAHLDQVEEAVELFYAGHFLIEDHSYDSNDRYSRHHLFYQLSGASGSQVQEKLKNKRVLILGCGGIGNLVAVNLATAGVGKLILMDQDEVELSNLTRQIMFEEDHKGISKAKVLKEQLLKRNSKVEVETFEKKVECYNDLSDFSNVDLIVVSADYGPALFWVNQFSFQNKIPWVNVGYVEDVAVWGPFVIPGKTGCYACRTNLVAPVKENSEERRKINEMISTIRKKYQAPSVGPVNMMASAHASLDIIKYLGEFGKIQSQNNRIGIWTDSLKIQKQRYTQSKQCKICRPESNQDEA